MHTCVHTQRTAVLFFPMYMSSKNSCQSCTESKLCAERWNTVFSLIYLKYGKYNLTLYIIYNRNLWKHFQFQRRPILTSVLVMASHTDIFQLWQLRFITYWSRDEVLTEMVHVKSQINHMGKYRGNRKSSCGIIWLHQK